MLAQFRLAFRQPILVPAEHALAGLGHGACSSGGRREFAEDLPPDAHIIGLAEIVLQALQPFCEEFGFPRRMKSSVSPEG
jgi:3-deoxy-D-manno-octulosonic acid (KDO) 8-phosphate synthase